MICLTVAMKYYNLEQLINMIPFPNNQACWDIYLSNKELFDTAKGSKIKHQAWRGGYIDHVADIMNIAIVYYRALNRCRPLPFALPDALLALFLHDLEKPWVYAKNTDERAVFESNEDRHEFVEDLIKKYKFCLTQEHRNAIRYAHGEGDDYHPTKRIQSPLAAFVHHCDNTSARIWFNYPRSENDSWKG